MKIHCYFDGIPQWIWDLTPEERAKVIAEEKAKMESLKRGAEKDKK